MNVRVEFEIRQLRHVAVQCPSCKNWFYGCDITDDELRDEIDLEFANFDCPVCGNEFGHRRCRETNEELHIVECDCDEVYKDCLIKKEKWEKP